MFLIEQRLIVLVIVKVNMKRSRLRSCFLATLFLTVRAANRLFIAVLLSLYTFSVLFWFICDNEWHNQWRESFVCVIWPCRVCCWPVLSQTFPPVFSGRATVWDYTFSYAGSHLQQNRQHQSSHHSTGLQRFLQGRISSVEKILLQLQPRIQSAGLHSSNEPRVHRTNADQRRRQQRLLLSLHLPDLLGVFHRVQRSVYQHCQRHYARIWTVCVYLQSPHLRRDSVPAGRDGAPVRVVVQVRFPLHHFRRRRKRSVLLVGRPHEPRVLARRPEPRGHPADVSAHRDAPGHPLPAEWLQPGLLLPDSLGVQLHGDQPLRLSPPVHQPAPVNAGRLQNGHPRLHRRFCGQRHDLRGQLRDK